MLRSSVTIKITGYNGTELLVKLQKEGVKLWKVRKTDKKTLVLTVSQKDSKKTFAICESMWYNYEVVSSFNLSAIFRKALLRSGLITGALFVVLFAVYSSGKLNSISISGNELVSREQIITALDRVGVRVGGRVSEISPTETYGALTSIGGIAEVSVKLDGNSLEIFVIEKAKTAVGADKGKAIVSDFDGVITSIACLSGTAKVKVGQVVKKGEVLIEGVTYSQTGEVLEQVLASGEVKAIVAERREKTVSLIKQEYALTGKKAKTTTLSFFGLAIGKAKNPFLLSETKEKSAVTTLLPIKIEQTTYYEQALTQTKSTLEQEISAFIEEIRGESETEIKTKHELIADNAYKITAILQTERKISKPV